jgi:hypothetical protein
LVRAEADAGTAIIENGLIRLEIIGRRGRLTEVVSAFDGESWVPVMKSRPQERVGLDLNPVVTSAAVLSRSATRATLRLTGARGAHSFTVDVTLEKGARQLVFEVADELANAQSLRSLQSRYQFTGGRPDFCFASHLRPHEGDVIGQYALKSPAAIVQSGRNLAAMIADVSLIGASAPMLVCFDVDASPHAKDGPTIAYGFKDHEPYGLIYFRHDAEMVRKLEPGALRYGYRLLVMADAEPKFGYREVVRALWGAIGQESARSVTPQVIPFDRYTDYALGYALPTLWRDLPGEPSRGGITMGIKFPNDVWFHFFFNHLHTAYGLRLMGERLRRPELVEKAERIRALALSAPTREGVPAAIHSHQIVTGIVQERWITNAHWVGGSIPYQTQIAGPRDFPAYGTMDASWTGYWMLRWYADIEQDPVLLERARAYGEKLLAVQLPSGAIPTYLDAETLYPLDHLRETPDCAASGLFLARLHQETGDERFLRAAERVARFLAEEAMPQRWADYESYYDSAGKPQDLFDGHTLQTPQNTFPIFWTAELCKLLYRITGVPAYLEQALRAVDYLLLFQGIWSPPFLSVKGFGSIAIGNGHTGWNDARSGIFAPGIAEFYELTGNIEYLQRGVAAMRAPLALMYIPENESVASSVFDKGPLGFADECYAHRGRDARLGPSCFDFSVGYALVAFNELWARYGSVFVDAAREAGVGVDGCSVKCVRQTGELLVVTLADTMGEERDITLRLSEAPKTDVEVRLKGKPLGRFTATKARRGMTLRVPGRG